MKIKTAKEGEKVTTRVCRSIITKLTELSIILID
jgi:hypothetical protein